MTENVLEHTDKTGRRSVSLQVLNPYGGSLTPPDIERFAYLVGQWEGLKDFNKDLTVEVDWEYEHYSGYIDEMVITISEK